MAEKPFWVRWYPKDALDGMHVLAPMEELAYRRILDMIFATGDRLPDDDRALAFSTKVGRGWKSVKARLVQLGKIRCEDGFIRNGRASEACIESASFVAQKSAAGRASFLSREAEAKRLKNKETASTDVGSPVATEEATGGSTNLTTTKKEAKLLLPDPISPRDPEPIRQREPEMPRIHAPPDAWMPLVGWRGEPDEAGVRRPLCGGIYLDAAARLVCEAADINDANWRGDWRPLMAWLEAGIDLHDEILPAVRRVAGRSQYRPPRSLAYFDQAVREARRAA